MTKNSFEYHSEVPLFSANPARPLKDLPFTLQDIKAAIPPEYFEADLATSWYYICRDFAQFVIAGVVAWYLDTLIPQDMYFLRLVLWFVHAFVQGATGFGLWVIAHECGHKAYFGKRPWLNTIVGYVCHTAMLAPYHSWRITHATHHRFTNHRYKDTAFPERRYPGYLYDMLRVFPGFAILHIVGYWLFGWPGHLLFNLEGNWYDRRANHFEPWSPLFPDSERWNIVITDIGYAAVLYGLYNWVQVFGFNHFACWYLGPIMCVYAFLITVTFLQHTDRDLPNYDDDDWDFLKGALSTVDRDYGIFNSWLHHITNGHLVHHLFSTMPFYNAIKATPIVAEKLGRFYHTDTRPLYRQLWDSWFAHQVSFMSSPMWLQRNGKQ